MELSVADLSADITKLRMKREKKKHKRHADRRLSDFIKEENENENDEDDETRKARKAAVLKICAGPKASLRTKAIGNRSEQGNNWNLLRMKLLSAKMRDAFRNSELDIMGKQYSIVRLEHAFFDQYELSPCNFSNVS